MVAIIHRVCNTNVVIEQREVVTLPSEKVWPKNIHVCVPICPMCKTIVGCDDLDILPVVG